MHQHLTRAVCRAGDRIVHDDGPDACAALNEPVYAVDQAAAAGHDYAVFIQVADLCHNCGLSKVSKVIIGGSTRMESALAGVSEVKKGARLIAIHDGARPLVTQDVINRVIYDASVHMSSIPVIPSTDTLKAVDDDGNVTGTVDRSRTVRVQTPQVFDADLIKGALTKAAKDALPITDDCSAMDIMGIKTHTVMGDVDNIKITTPNDMVTAEAIIKNRGDWNANRAWV